MVDRKRVAEGRMVDLDGLPKRLPREKIDAMVDVDEEFNLYRLCRLELLGLAAV